MVPLNMVIKILVTTHILNILSTSSTGKCRSYQLCTDYQVLIHEHTEWNASGVLEQ